MNNIKKQTQIDIIGLIHSKKIKPQSHKNEEFGGRLVTAFIYELLSEPNSAIKTCGYG